ncbi:unnamed protein product, partial [Schistosoma turkestanicum]
MTRIQILRYAADKLTIGTPQTNISTAEYKSDRLSIMSMNSDEHNKCLMPPNDSINQK